MTRAGGNDPVALTPQEEALRPLYSRVLRLRSLDPGGLLCFAFFEGSIVLAVLLALAELVNWWSVPVFPVLVAIGVKFNDIIAAAVLRSAARVPQVERERLRRELSPAVGRAAVPSGRTRPAGTVTGAVGPVVLASATRRFWPGSDSTRQYGDPPRYRGDSARHHDGLPRHHGDPVRRPWEDGSGAGRRGNHARATSRRRGRLGGRLGAIGTKDLGWRLRFPPVGPAWSRSRRTARRRYR